MTGHLLSKVVSDGKETMDKIMEVVPFIVIGALWLLGAIAKTVKSGKKGMRPEIQQKTKVKQRQPENLADFIRMVKEQYTAAKQQVMEKTEKASEKVSKIQQTISQPYEESFKKPPMFELTTPAPMPTIEKPVTFEKAVVEELQPALGPRPFVPEQRGMPGEVLTEELTSPSMRYASNPYLKDISQQFGSSGNLKRAIIYSEILRPPLALR
jgi:hypothetical protein